MNRIKNLLAATAVLILGSGTLAAQDVNDVIDKYNAAAELYSAKQFAEAIPALEDAIAVGLEVGPDAAEIVQNAQKLLPGAYFRVGGAYVQAGDFDNAIANFTKAAELAELYGDINIMRNATGWISQATNAKGADAFNSKDYKTAISIFESGYAANPTDTDLALNLAKSYGEDGQLDKAREVYGQIIGLTHSKYADAVAQAKEELAVYIITAANEANGAGNVNGAYELLDSFLDIAPDSPTANLIYIQIATNQKNWDKVIEKGEAAAQAQTDEELKSNA
ncbi:MAG: tetratricopeptide repeat protein, partial [Alistipes sp.]|nr:tetratricopeptide repeat protein [Alistipes sp.]